jgi:hypothetical protein
MGYSVVTTVLAFAVARYGLADLATVKDERSIGADDIADDSWLTRAIATGPVPESARP